MSGDMRASCHVLAFATCTPDLARLIEKSRLAVIASLLALIPLDT